MPRQKKKHHNRGFIKPAKRHRNKILNRDLDTAYNHFAGSRLHDVLNDLKEMSEYHIIAKAYYLALRTEVANRRAKKHKGDMRLKLYKQKVIWMNQLISHCQLNEYRVERSRTTDVAGPSDILFCYLPECEQISWHCNLGALPLPISSEEWDGEKFSSLRKLETAIQSIFYPSTLSPLNS